MINYLHLRGYRNLCEYLNGQWYKFAEIKDIQKNCKGVLPILYNPKDKRISKFLWDNYLIQFMCFSKHPILNYTNSTRKIRRFKGVYGWALISDWEYKIEYLESIVLFSKEPKIKAWETDLRKRINDRKRREEAKQLQVKFRSLSEEEAKIEARQLGICWRCLKPIIPFMIDCISCGANQ
jgi:hypothetical protein